MVSPRTNPYVHVTWLAKIMAGEAVCHWQYWFQAHNQLSQRMASSPELVGWQVEHSRMVMELATKLAGRGGKLHREYRIKLRTARHEAVVAGSIDCLVDEDSRVTIYECKVGQPRQSDLVQTMVYMHCVSQLPVFAGKSVRGFVIYKDQHSPIPELPENFAANFDYFVDLLAGTSPALKFPGPDCRFCRLTVDQCPERAEERSGEAEGPGG